MSRLFGRTLRETPAGVETRGHEYLLRGGFVRQLTSRIFGYLPLAKRTMRKIEGILREEMDAIGGQEMEMLVVHPAELWKQTGRWDAVGPELGRFRDRSGRDMALAMTHEEVVAALAGGEIQSYHQLPALVYHLGTKWRDDARPRAGLIRTREFTLKVAYSLDRDEGGLDRQYQAQHRAYFRIFGRCALPAIAVESDVGMMGGSMAHEFMHLSPVGRAPSSSATGAATPRTARWRGSESRSLSPNGPNPSRRSPLQARIPSSSWPVSVAPYHVHFVAHETLDSLAAGLCGEIEAAGFEVLHDDRDVSRGVKFKDADLTGAPIR